MRSGGLPSLATNAGGRASQVGIETLGVYQIAAHRLEWHYASAAQAAN